MINHIDENENAGDIQNLKSEDTGAKDHLSKLKVEKQLNYDLTGDSYENTDNLSLPGDDISDSVYAERVGSDRVEVIHGSVAQDKSAIRSSSPSKFSCRVLHGVPTDAHYMNDDL